jgi:hypothetical protein
MSAMRSTAVFALDPNKSLHHRKWPMAVVQTLETLNATMRNSLTNWTVAVLTIITKVSVGLTICHLLVLLMIALADRCADDDFDDQQAMPHL